MYILFTELMPWKHLSVLYGIH